MNNKYETPAIKVAIIKATPILAGSLKAMSDEQECSNGWGAAQSKDYFPSFSDDEADDGCNSEN